MTSANNKRGLFSVMHTKPPGKAAKFKINQEGDMTYQLAMNRLPCASSATDIIISFRIIVPPVLKNALPRHVQLLKRSRLIGNPLTAMMPIDVFNAHV